MSPVILVVGTGLLADLVCRELSPQYPIVRQADLQEEVMRADLALVLHDTWQPAVHQRAEKVFRSYGIPWIRGFVAFGEAVIGPLVQTGEPGCSQCADLRQLMGGRDRKQMWELLQRLRENGGKAQDVWASRSGLLQVAHLLADQVHRVWRNSQPSLVGHVMFVHLKTLKSSRHFFLPEPSCMNCGHLPDDSAQDARITLAPSPKIHLDSYRCQAMDDLQARLTKDYLDHRTGFLHGKMRDLVSTFANVSVKLPLFVGDESTAGRTHSYAYSESTAILEGLERYCGITPRGKRTVVRDSYHNLAEHALHPVQVGVHAPEQYESPEFPFQPFDPQQPSNWVWGYSFSQDRPILVPELLAYYSLGAGQGFVYETSNGCALGGSLEEAIFYGILEVVERDSFLLTWYARLNLPRLDPYSAPDQELHLMIDRLRAVAGYDIYLYNATMENGIPSVWTMAKNRKDTGVNVICAAGAHPDPIRAVKSSIYETAAMLLTLDDKFEANREEYVRMYHDSSLVTKMEHHSMLYALPQAEERLDFLLNDKRPMRTFEQEFKERKRHADLTDDLKDLLRTFQELNLDVIVVDQTSPEILRNGLHCVKVLIPGMLPMTFGHHLTRLTGLERVLQVPADLGYVKQALTWEQLNPHPHPFP